ncbi:branched-chain amino acid ABC transporter permease [Ammonifex thiophilus]|uniref:Branched-chain amino acid ABC transporter permease n=1 Tax=Ammonifex thiophilus TaxID=444093 RepID=A0A3D8P3G2_9THEO|nr:branched-chain amino acid ABC transporter permease [Ammonifex thiophilus]RDV83398.1 branched-chain amino acid ABC transporter permease [Ammonifex thiophilus]
MVVLLQLLLNSLITGSIYLLAGTGLTLTYGLSRFPNFAYAELITLGGFVAYTLLQHSPESFWAGLLLAFLTCGLVSVLSYRLVFSPLVNRRASLIPLMVASIGLGYVLRYTMGEIWSWSDLGYPLVWTAYNWGGLRVTSLWLYLIAVALSAALLLHLFFKCTKVGLAIRAIATNPDLAQVSGINLERVILFTWFLGAALAGVAGVFRAADTQLYPMMGWDILLPVFAAVVLGGIGSFYGLIIASYLLGLAENVGVVFLQATGLSTEYRMAIAFLVLILVLIFRPRGLLGR